MILQICPSDYPPFQDLCVVYEQALRSLGRDVTTVILQPARGEPVPGFRYLDREDLRPTRKIAAQLKRLLAAVDVTLAICHRYRSAQVAKRLGVDRLVVAHEFGYFDRLQRRLSARLDRRTRYAGVSPAVVSELERVCGTALYLPNAVDVDSITRLDRAEARSVLGLPAAGQVVGWVGRMHHKKRPELAVQATALVAGKVTLAMLGQGELARADAHGFVVRCGYVAQARRLYSAFDVLLITATSAEAFGMTALEAMCSGVPVVCGHQPGPAHVLGELGCYYEDDQPASIAAALSRGLSLDRASFVERANKRVEEKFSVHVLARKLSDVIDMFTSH